MKQTSYTTFGLQSGPRVVVQSIRGSLIAAAQQHKCRWNNKCSKTSKCNVNLFNRHRSKNPQRLPPNYYLVGRPISVNQESDERSWHAIDVTISLLSWWWRHKTLCCQNINKQAWRSWFGELKVSRESTSQQILATLPRHQGMCASTNKLREILAFVWRLWSKTMILLIVEKRTVLEAVAICLEPTKTKTLP